MMFSWIKKQDAQNLIDLALLPITSRLTKLEQSKPIDISSFEKRLKDLEDFKKLVEDENKPFDCKQVTWNQSGFVKTVYDGYTMLKLSVLNADDNKVYFKSNYEDWKEGDLKLPQTGNCEPIWFKVGDCEVWGCVTIEKQENLIKFISSCS